MERALRVCLALYFPLLLCSLVVFFGEFTGEGWSSPLFLPLFSLWLADGLVGLVCGLRVLLFPGSLHLEQGRFSRMALGMTGVLLGIPCVFIAAELLAKLFRLLLH